MAAGADRGGVTGASPSGEARAAEAVRAQPAFRTPMMARAESQSGRLADRWAPEGPRAARAPAMRTLGFADHVIGTYLGEGAGRVRRPGAGAVDRRVAPMDWLFPVPWYFDELDWLSAGRAAAWESERAAIRSGERSAPALPVATATPRSAQASSVSSRPPEPAPVRFDLPLELVAPALAASRSAEAGGRRGGAVRAAPAALRAYSPVVDPASARAAEFLAELLARNAAAASGPAAARAGEGASLVESAYRPAPLLEYVAPAELVAPAAQRSHVTRAAQETLEAARQAELVARERAALSAAASEAAVVRTPPPAAGSELARIEALRAEQAAALATARSQEERSELAARSDALAAERQDAARALVVEAEAARVEAMRAEATRVEAARTEIARAESARAEVARAEAARRVVPASPSRRAIELLAAGALSGERGGRMALSAGPRVLLPAGLGGLVAAADQARAVHQPVAGAAAARRARSAVGAVHTPLAAARPAAIDHLVWSDRWLSRFAGASTSALISFDMVRAGQTATRAGAAPAWEPAWVSAQPAPERAASRAAASAERLARGAPGRVLTAAIVDEDQPVGDDVLAAIAAAAASERSDRQRPPRPRPAGPAEPRGPFRPSAADRSLARVALPTSAGLHPALGASPVAAVLSSLIGGATQVPFDARPLSMGSVSDFLARGLSRAPSVAPSQAMAARAPGTAWLSLAPPRGDVARNPLRAVGSPTSLASSATSFDGAAAGRAPRATSAREAPFLSLVAPDATGEASPGAAASSAARAVRASAAAASARAAREASAARASASARSAAWLGSAVSARPGAFAVGAEGFASARAAAAADLSLDFLSPEVLVAARAFGFTPVDAVRAQHLAAAGRPALSRLAGLVDQVFVSALSPAGDRMRSAPGATAAEIASLAPQRMPRGSFLMPAASSRALGVTAGQAETGQPGIAAALELVAAGQVAEVAEGAAAQRVLAAGGAAHALAEPGGVGPVAGEPVSREGARARGDRLREAAQERAATEAARDLLPRHLWSVFDAVYLSLGEETVASDVRPLGPAARAARALALASRARGPEDLPLSARARAAAAWAVLPVVMTGGAPVAPGGSAAAARLSRPGSAAAPGFTARYAAGGMAETSAVGAASVPGATPSSARSVAGAPFAADDAPRRSRSVRAGEALASLVAPAFFRGDDRGDGYGPVPAERARPVPTFVDTGSRPQPAAPPPAPAPRPAPRPAPAASAEPSKKEFEAWFQSAAQKYFGEAPSATGLTVAEMTLVTSAPREQIAASQASATGSPSPQTVGGGGTGAAEGPAGGVPQAPNIDKIAQDVYDQICRMLAVARERSGDPWNR